MVFPYCSRPWCIHWRPILTLRVIHYSLRNYICVVVCSELANSKWSLRHWLIYLVAVYTWTSRWACLLCMLVHIGDISGCSAYYISLNSEFSISWRYVNMNYESVCVSILRSETGWNWNCSIHIYVSRCRLYI